MTQALSSPDLWQRLSSLSFDIEGAEFPFTARLARDNGWSADFAARALEEYRRFAYLAMVSEGSVTPSDEVDQVWHLHLTYTRHYWGPFQEALGAPLHHGPTRGGEAQGQLFRGQYAQTQELYRQEFGEAPPLDLWPDEAVRFGKAPTARRVLTADYLLIPRTAVRRAATSTAAAAGLALLLPVAARAASLDDLSAYFQENRAFVIFVAGFLVFIGVVIARDRSASGGRKRSDGGGGGDVPGDGADGGGSGCGSGCGGCGGG